MTSWRGDTGRSHAPNNNNGCSCIAVTNARHPSRNSGLHGQAHSNHGTRTTRGNRRSGGRRKSLGRWLLDSLSPLIAARGARIDRQFEDKVMTPGFIDPHVHPTLPAVLTQFPFLHPMTGICPPEISRERQRLRATEVHCKIWSRNMMMRQYRLSLLAITRCGTARCGGMISTTGLAIHPS